MQTTIGSPLTDSPPKTEAGSVKREKINRAYVRKVRYAFQWGLFVLIAYGGYRLYLFADHFLTGNSPSVQRPPLVDGFLPIGSFMTLKLWLATDIFDHIHPAGLVIFVTALAMSLLLRKSFCGWICPVGTLSELLYRAGARVFGRNFTIPKYIDYPFRSLKYLLMGFFLYVVLLKMNSAAIRAFLDTPYWKVADVKMLFFFTKMTVTTMVVLSALIALSIVFKNFWCRYLCPYGALVGLLGFLSPFRITRNEDACIHCKRCTRHCPSLIPVEQRRRVRTPECTGCLTCVSRCPSRGALDVALPGNRTVKPLVFATLVAVVFFGAIGLAKLTGNWQSATTYEEYKALVPIAQKFEHP